MSGRRGKGETSVDLRIQSIKDTEGRSHGMYEEVADNGRGERGM